MAVPFEDYPQFRRWMYNAYICAGLLLGAMQAWFVSIPTAVMDATTHSVFPSWFVGALSAYSFLGLAMGFVASANTPKTGG